MPVSLNIPSRARVNTRTVLLFPVFDKPCDGDGSRPQRMLAVVVPATRTREKKALASPPHDLKIKVTQHAQNVNS